MTQLENGWTELARKLEEVTAELEQSERQRKSAIDQFLAMRDERDKLKAERDEMMKEEPVGEIQIGDSGSKWVRLLKSDDEFYWKEKLYAHPPVPDGKVLVDARTLLSIRNELIMSRVNGAYDLLYHAVGASDPYNPWKEWEDKSMLQAAQNGG